MDGVLVVFDTESSATDVQCMSVDFNVRHTVKMYLESKSQTQIHDMRTLILVFRPPVITGMTTLSKGNTLFLAN